MRSVHLLLLFLLSLSVSVTAQDDFMVAFSVSGKVKYKAGKKARAKRLKQSTLLFPEAMVKVKKKASLSLYYGREYQTLDKKGKYFVSDLMKEADGKRARFVAPLFDDYLMASAGDKGGKEGRGGIGFGDSRFKIVPFQPYHKGEERGKVSGPEIKFRWQSRKEVDPSIKTFKLKIIKRGGDVIHETTVEGFEYILKVADISLEYGNYRWQVEATADSDISSPQVAFAYVDAAEEAKVLERMKKDEVYQMGDPAAKIFFEAAQLEKSGFHYAAYERYLMVNTQYPGNEVLKMALQRYLERNDLVEDE
ncbi:MAG: hypothetical protein KTR30_37500 [Saprospiraceae bacterium]|nr:hypothetical protein [Saprospiraceae bacterium]